MVATWMLLAPLIALFCGVVAARFWFQSRKPSKFTVAFFHPYCNDGGGGERVLWRSIDALQQLDKGEKLDIVVYSGDSGVTDQDILDKAYARFSIKLQRKPKFVFLKKRYLVEASLYPYFTMVGQSVGSVFFGLEALLNVVPHVFIDTMGYSWTFPIFSILGGSFVSAYVHYPTISTDMLSKVASRASGFNNDDQIASSGWKTTVKLIYYNLFAASYWFMGQFSSFTMVNSSWTKEHIRTLWRARHVELVYPPCDTTGLKALPLEGKNRMTIVSIAQFRPEKNHSLQVSLMDRLVNSRNTGGRFNNAVLYMIGSLRTGNEEDAKLVESLKEEIRARGLEKHVVIATGVSNDELKNYFAKAAVGLHTMSHEHFGIGIVELQAAAVVPLANDSAGPKADIVVDGTGMLATTLEQYTDALVELLTMSEKRWKEMATKARENASRFSDEAFVSHIQQCFEKMTPIKRQLSSQ